MLVRTGRRNTRIRQPPRGSSIAGLREVNVGHVACAGDVVAGVVERNIHGAVDRVD